ncbi:MAG: sulfurtransferase TusA family protein [Bacillota bacterium]
MEKIKADAALDITADVCPITFVKTKLVLEEMTPGEILEVTLNGGEPIQNVPRSVKDEGHKIVRVEALENNKFRLLIERGQD